PPGFSWAASGNVIAAKTSKKLAILRVDRIALPLVRIANGASSIGPVATVCRRRAIGREFLRPDDGHVQADLHRDRFLADLDRHLVVDIPAERTGGEFLDIRWHRNAVDDDLNRLGVRVKLGARNRTTRFLGHRFGSPLTPSKRQEYYSRRCTGERGRGGEVSPGEQNGPTLPTPSSSGTCRTSRRWWSCPFACSASHERRRS